MWHSCFCYLRTPPGCGTRAFVAHACHSELCRQGQEGSMHQVLWAGPSSLAPRPATRITTKYTGIHACHALDPVPLPCPSDLPHRRAGTQAHKHPYTQAHRHSDLAHRHSDLAHRHSDLAHRHSDLAHRPLHPTPHSGTCHPGLPLGSTRPGPLPVSLSRRDCPTVPLSRRDCPTVPLSRRDCPTV